MPAGAVGWAPKVVKISRAQMSRLGVAEAPQERRVFRDQMLVGHNRSRIASFLFSRLEGFPQFTGWKIEMLDVQASIEMTWTRGSAPCDVVRIIDREQYYPRRE